ncbi:MAG: S8 family serine peptidase [Actinomycetia bacterium]|nr:S8 family serine peptidase [Actinomycetes bacterium]
MKPAYAWQFDNAHLAHVPPELPAAISPEWAWGGSTGGGVKVGIVDSGVDGAHPLVGSVAGGVAVEYDPHSPTGVRYNEGPHEDLFGHGTACAAIVRKANQDADIYSIRVLGKQLSGKGFVFAAGLRWALDHGIQVVNLSLSTPNRTHFAAFHRLIDEAVHRRVMVVSAMNNWPGRSYPSEFAGVFSVAAHDGTDPFALDFNPHPPAEWGAPGIDIEIAGLDGSTMRATGNSFAAPHITGLITRILAKHPSLNVFQMKAVLQALATNAQ